MKRKYLFIFISLLAASMLLSSCSGSSINPSSWPGITVVDNIAYVAYNQYVYGVQVSNGTETTRLPESAISGSTTFFHDPLVLDDHTLLEGDYKTEIYTLDMQTKTATPFFSDASGRWIAAPLLAEGMIYAASTDNTVYALDTNGNAQWTFSTGESIWASPVISGSLVYIASMDHYLYALDAQTGKEVWKTDMGGTMVSAPYVAEDGTLYIGTFNSEVLAVDGQEGNILWQIPTEDWVWGTPVVGDGVLYVTDLSGKVYAINLSDHTSLWQFQGSGSVSGSVLLQNDSVIFATSGGVLYCLNTSGGLRWQASVGGDKSQFAGTPIGTENSILVASIGTEAILYAYNYEGTLQWQFVPQK